MIVSEPKAQRLGASVLVVLDRTFDDAEELREFSLRYLAFEHVHALRSRERGCFLVVQTLWAEKIQSTTDAGSLNTFAEMKSKLRLFHRHFFALVFSNTIQNLLFRTKNSQPMGCQ